MVRFISVDSVLQDSSEIPSGQNRNPLANLHRSRAPNAPHPRHGDPRRLVPQNLPVRSSKLSEKLVLLPETADQHGEWRYDEDEGDDVPIKDDEEEWRNRLEDDDSVPPRKSYAERLPKSRRAEKLSRVTAYCTADGYRLNATSKFLREKHAARTKLYDECLYCAYHLPLMRGVDGCRVRSSPVLKSPGGKPVLDVQIEESEQRDYHEGYFDSSYQRQWQASGSEHTDGEEDGGAKLPEDARFNEERREREREENERPESPRGQQMDMKSFAEMFVFSYGVVVFWNFTERQEKDILADLTFAGGDMGTSLISGPMKEEDFETEEFHFEYSSRTRSPRIYNDMITLRSGDIMIKLAISHAIAQSTKLCRFEERMNTTMLNVQHIPKKLALTGKLGMRREDVVKMSGRLFKLRVDVNLSSNVLDVPEFFWDAEPTLHPLYAAVREYLEIKQRILVLNERCRVFLDLADILSDSIADSNMSRITWIIIILIVLSILVTVAEVAIRFGILNAKKRAANPGAALFINSY
ncbi:Sad1-interacting factor 3 [Rhizina undulata]